MMVLVVHGVQCFHLPDRTGAKTSTPPRPHELGITHYATHPNTINSLSPFDQGSYLRGNS